MDDETGPQVEFLDEWDSEDGEKPKRGGGVGWLAGVLVLLVVLAVIGYVLWLVRRRKQIEAERKRRRRAQLEAEEARRRAQMRETLHEFDRDYVGSGRR